MLIKWAWIESFCMSLKRLTFGPFLLISRPCFIFWSVCCNFKGHQRKWLQFNAKWTIFQLYHGKNKLHLDEEMMLISVSSSEDINTNLWSEPTQGQGDWTLWVPRSWVSVCKFNHNTRDGWVRGFMVFSTTFNNISAISWW